MAGVNKVILIGNLGADPEVRHLPSGAAVANFNIATSESFTNKNGERVTQTEWHRIEAWEGLARIAEQYLKKGNTIYVEGKLRTEEWQDKDGNNRYTTKIRATSMTMLGGRGENGGGSQSSSQAGGQSKMNEPSPTSFSEEDTDDLPF